MVNNILLTHFDMLKHPDGLKCASNDNHINVFDMRNKLPRNAI